MADDGKYLHVSIGLPGIAEEQIRIDLERTTITLSIWDDERMFEKVIQVPSGARIFKKKVSDGILEIVLEKPVV
jgi:HSP20 family molecular chaperone IbpA